MRVAVLLSIQVAFLLSFVRSTAADDAIPEPSFDRIDYSRPDDYICLETSFGDAARIRTVAASLQSAKPEESLAAIARWIHSNLKYDASAAYDWRDFDAALAGKVYGGCADHAVVFTALARACGVPTVFVKTMDADWIREFRKAGACTSWRGHVFLEVYLDGRWRLLDAQAEKLYDDYDPRMRLLPGHRFAYDKGSDPKALVLSPDWERWKKQTTAYFADFDVLQLPLDEGRDLGGYADDVYIAADSPVYQALTERCQGLGLKVRASFNTRYDDFLPRARGKYLIVASVGDRLVLPEEYVDRYLPISHDDLKRRVARGESGVERGKLDDGTRVALFYAKDVDAMLRVVSTMEAWPKQ